MCATQTATSVEQDMDKLTSDWFEELRQALNSAKRWKRTLFSDSRLGTKFEEDYAKLRKHLLDLEQCGAPVGDYQKQYDEIVDTANQAKEDKSPAGVKDVLEKIKALDQTLIKEKKKQKEALGKRSWNPTREDVRKALMVASENWLTETAVSQFESEAKTILGSALRAKKVKGKLVPSDEDTQLAFADLLSRLNKAISSAEIAAKKFLEDKSTARKALAVLKKSAGPSDVAPLEDRYNEALTLVEDNNDYARASRRLGKLTTDISEKQQGVKSAEGDYKLAETAATEAIKQLRGVTSEAVCSRFETRLHASQRDAELGEFGVAKKGMEQLKVDVDKRFNSAKKAKEKWEGNQLRVAIKNKAKHYRESRNDNPYFALVANLDGELGVIESTASETHDYERADRELLALEVSLKDRESKIDKLKRVGEPPAALKARSKMALEESELSDQLDALSKKFDGPIDRQSLGKEPMAFIRTGDDAFRGKIAAIRLEVDQAVIGGDSKKILAAYKKAAQDYKQLAAEVKAVVEDDQKFDAYKLRLKNEKEARDKISAASKKYDKARTLAEQDLLRLEDIGVDVGSLRPDFEKFSDPKNISNDDPGGDFEHYAAKFVKLSQDIQQQLQANATKVKDGRTKMQESIDNVKKAVKKHAGEASRKKYCAQIELELEKLKPLLNSTNLDVLLVGKERAEKLLTRANGLDDPGKQNELVQQRNMLAGFKKSLKNKDLKKYVPNTRADLKVALASAEELVYSGEPAQTKLDELTLKFNAAGTAAASIKTHRKTLDKNLKSIEHSLKDLTDKIVEHAKGDKNLKGKDIKGKSFGDHQTKLDEIGIKAKGEKVEMFEKAIKLSEELIDELQSASPQALANAESTQIDKDLREQELWKWDLHTALNGAFKDALKYAEETNDKSGAKLLEQLRDKAVEAAKKKDYRAARNQLAGLERQAANMLGSAVGVHGSKKLEPLKAAWHSSLKTCRAKLKLLAAAVAKEPDIEYDGAKLDTAAKDKLVKGIKLALKRFERNGFDKPIDALLKEEDPAARRAARENGLTRVRKYQRRLHEDPVMRVLNRKAFGVQVPLKSMHDVLNRLDLLLQINN